MKEIYKNQVVVNKSIPEEVVVQDMIRDIMKIIPLQKIKGMFNIQIEEGGIQPFESENLLRYTAKITL